MKILIVLLGLLLVAPVWAQEVDIDVINAEVEIVLDKDMDLNGLEVEIESQSFLLGADIVIDKSLTLSPKIGLNRTQLTGQGIDTGDSLGLCLGLDVEYFIADIGPLKAYAVGGYRYTNSEFNLHEGEIGIRADMTDLFPYGLIPSVGMVLSGAQTEVLGNKINADTNIGMRLGLRGEVIEGLTVSIEASLIDEKSLGGKVSYIF